MPVKKAAWKALRQSKKRHARNIATKVNVRAVVKKTRQAIAGNAKDEAAKALKEALKALDKAVQKGVIKKNTAARKKSRLTLQYNKLAKQAA
ncbi:MAG: 30S ribosomal protein S20 [Patescibacteria group bacterium]|jgi:small subunit ribosomal protein S20